MPKNPFSSLPKLRPKRLREPPAPSDRTSADSTYLDWSAQRALSRLKAKRRPKKDDRKNELNFGRPPRKPHLYNA